LPRCFPSSRSELFIDIGCHECWRSSKDIGEVVVGIYAVHLTGSDNGIHDGGPDSAPFVASKEPVVPTERNGPDLLLDTGVTEFDYAVLDERRECRLRWEEIRDSLLEGTLRKSRYRELREIRFELS
jgi:hypothetical protein